MYKAPDRTLGFNVLYRIFSAEIDNFTTKQSVPIVYNIALLTLPDSRYQRRVQMLVMMF